MSFGKINCHVFLWSGLVLTAPSLAVFVFCQTSLPLSFCCRENFTVINKKIQLVSKMCQYCLSRYFYHTMWPNKSTRLVSYFWTFANKVFSSLCPIIGSSHSSSPGKSQNSIPANTPNPHGQRYEGLMNSLLLTSPFYSSTLEDTALISVWNLLYE